MSRREPRWDADAAIGRQGELFVTSTLHAIGTGASREVKTDLRAPETGRVYIEFECNGKPSGIKTTRAALWSIVLGPPGGVVLVVATERLRNAARRAWLDPRNRVAQRRGGYPTRGVAIPLHDLAAWAAEDPST